jgi:CRP/FNR family nitrogen fixation transcriptional regulator
VGAMLVRIGEENAPPGLREVDALLGQDVFFREFTYRRGSEIFGESERAEYLYQVCTGAVRSYKLLSDGRRQINAFHLPGDVFGVESGQIHRFTTEAIVETRVQVMTYGALFDAYTDSGVPVINNVLKLVTRNLQHAESHTRLLGRKTSLEKVAAFLIEMDRRLTAAGVMILPMSRRDIADYLGLKVETVSRALAILKGAGVLDFVGQAQRQIVLLNGLTKLDS